MRRIVPAALVAIPLFYYFGLLVGAAMYPGYSHATRYASELGAADALYPELFNYAIVLAGLAALVAAAGLPGTVGRLTGRRIWAALAAAALAVWGVSMVMGGWFPMPDERHIAYGMGLAAPLVPLFTLLGLRGAPEAGAMRAFLAFIFVGQVVLLAIMFGVGELVRQSNVGIWQRINSAFGIPWLAILGIWLMRRAGAGWAMRAQA